MITKKYLDDLTYQIIGGAIEVHKCMGNEAMSLCGNSLIFIDPWSSRFSPGAWIGRIGRSEINRKLIIFTRN